MLGNPQAALAVIPRPAQVNPIADAPAIVLNGAKIIAPSAYAAEAALIRDAFKGDGSATIRFEPASGAVNGFEIGNEGYAIINEPGCDIVISAHTRAGFFYAYQTLLQASEIGADGKSRLAPGTILDKPRFAWRGLMLDEGRHFFGKERVKRLLDLMAIHKLNVFHWHLAEDQGWRVEIKKWPKLTEVGAWRDESPVMGERTRGDGRPYGGFYTQADLREVVAHAAKLHITVVPEIEMTGHSAAAIAASGHAATATVPPLSTGPAPQCRRRRGTRGRSEPGPAA